MYLDDIIVLGRTFEDHLFNLAAVFDRLCDAGLRLKPSKCSFLWSEVEYLGHVISRDGVATDPSKLEKVANWPTPNSTREIQQFLGFARYYRRFIKVFAQMPRYIASLSGVQFSIGAVSVKTAFDDFRK